MKVTKRKRSVAVAAQLEVSGVKRIFVSIGVRVEAGFMTNDLALLVGNNQPFLNTKQYLEKVAGMLEK